MNLNQIKNIKITDYLYSKGIQTKKIKGADYWYISPYREEKTPSFKVNNDLNVWYDYGTGEGGNIIDLIMKMYNLNSITDVLNHFSTNNYQQRSISQNIPQKQPDSFSFEQQKESSSIEILKVQLLTNKALIDYLTERKININIAKEHCKEVYYSIGDKRYFALGFRNESGGYELRNKYFKGCTSKDITIYQPQISNQQGKQNREVCLVFEGFTDFLSYLTIKDRIKLIVDTVILNSTANLSKAMGFIKTYNKVYTFLDNDSTGKKATELIAKAFSAVINQSLKYIGCNDLNDYLCKHNLKKKEAEPIKQKAVITQPKRSRKL